MVWQRSVAWPLGWALLIAGLLIVGLLAWQMMVPRLASQHGDLLVFLRAGRPIRLPLEFVECFFLSSGSGQVPAPGGDLPVRNLVLRVAERAVDYQNCKVKSALGSWADGYITFHGAWCEPLNLEVVKTLNGKLSALRQNLDAAPSVQSAG
jgi:hypothetical protein